MSKREIKEGYSEELIREPFILEPEDWSESEWKTLCKLCGLPADRTERIVLRASKIEFYITRSEDIVEKRGKSEKPTVVEQCPECENEVELEWNVKTQGYETVCPKCGKQLMLCDACLHSDDATGCDYGDNGVDRCHRMKGENDYE